MLNLLKYATKLLGHLSDNSVDEEDDNNDNDDNENQIDMTISLSDLLNLCDNDKKKLMLVTTNLLQLLQQHLSDEKTHVIFKNTDSAQNAFLELFQNCLHLSNEVHEEGLFWEVSERSER